MAALIVAALIKKVLDVADFWKLFKKSKLDGLAWLITFLSVLVFDVDIGLYLGVVSTLLLTVFKSQRARSTLLGNIPGTNIFECVNTCREAREYKHVKIIRYEESVYYANVDNFKYKVIKLAGVKPSEVLAEIEQTFGNFLGFFLMKFNFEILGDFFTDIGRHFTPAGHTVSMSATNLFLTRFGLDDDDKI